MKRIFMLEENDIAVMQRGQAIALPVGMDDILLTMERRAYPAEVRVVPEPVPRPQRRNFSTKSLLRADTQEEENTSAEWLTVPEVARHFGLTPRAIHARLKQGSLQGVRQGTRWRIPASALTSQPHVRRSHIPQLSKKNEKRHISEITTAAAAKRLGVSTSDVIHKLVAGVLPGRKISLKGRERWLLPQTVSWGKEGIDFQRTKTGRRIRLGKFPCGRCRPPTIWRSALARGTHINRVHTKSITVPGQGR